MEQVEDQVSFVADEVTRIQDQSGAASELTEQVAGADATDTLASASGETVSQQLKKLQTVLTNLPAIVYAIDRLGVITLLDGKGVEMLKHPTRETIITSMFDLYHGIPEVLSNWRRALLGESFTALNEVDGRILESRFSPVRDANDEVTSIICVATDVTERNQAEKTRQIAEARLVAERMQAEAALRSHERRFRSMIEQASDLVLIVNKCGIYQYASPSHLRLMGYVPETLLSTDVFNLIHPDDIAHVRDAFAMAFQNKEMVAHIECRVRHANGSWVILDCVGRNCLDDPAIQGFIINARDVSERRAMEEILRHKALHDSLTDLPNSALLQERLERALQYAEQHDLGVALLIINIDRFKDINDTFGHQHGDMLQQQIATRLRQAVSCTETVARLDGDEFAILLSTADVDSSIDNRALAAHKALEAPFCVAGNPLQIEASIGGVLYPVHGKDPLTLMRRAHVAMYNAKHMHERYMLYDATHDDQDSSRRIALLGALRQAIADDGLKLYYQPKVDLKTGVAYSTEALARWQHPTYGFVPPDQFISLAEQTGLIASLTQWVLATAIKQCSNWLRSGLDLNIAVNLSMWNLRDARLPETIADLLEKYNVPPRLLRVELTESAVMTDIDRSLDVLTRISALGVRISIDDFGTGYSSLAYLKRLPVDELKIDRSFVQHISKVEADATIVSSMVTMAHGLGLQVVAEGVEDQVTWRILDTLNCDIAQGYYISRPLPARDFEDWLRNVNRQPHSKEIIS